MDENDLKNTSLISSIVENHFGLDDKSFSFFKREIQKTTLDPYFEALIKQHNSSDLRIRFKIPKEICSILDNGWKLFSSTFSKFIEKYNFSYDNFISNKVLVEKNNIKIRKALVSYYTDINNYMAFRREIAPRVMIESAMSLKLWEEKKTVDDKLIKIITDYIDKILDAVSQKCLPKTDIHLVLSLNFADWFLCSTAESWKSCLNLESEFHGAYWSGLPGLIGDKNRCLFYITDGNKKTYQGITVDKIIARAWGILSENDYLYIVKPYPLADLFDARIVSTLTNIKMRDLGQVGEFTSKNKVDLLFFNEERHPSCFIFQDHSGFTEDLKIIRASGGFYAFVGNKMTKGEPVIRYESGLINLINKKENIKNYIIKKKICERCGHSSEEVLHYVIDGIQHELCPNCLKEDYKKCSCCRQYHSKKIFTEIKEESGNTNLVCNNCLKIRYSKCEICGSYYAKRELYKLHDNCNNISRVCLSCVKNLSGIVKCPECHEYMPKENLYQADLLGEEFMCEHCLTVYSDNKQMFFEFEDEDEEGTYVMDEDYGNEPIFIDVDDEVPDEEDDEDQ